MRRRIFIAGLGAASSVVVLSPYSVLAQAGKKVARIGFLSNARGLPQPLLDGLRERG